jgi:hypothetical protein
VKRQFTDVIIGLAICLTAGAAAAADGPAADGSAAGRPAEEKSVKVALGPAVLKEPAATMDSAEQKPGIAEQKKPESLLFPLRFGIDNYTGMSNQPGRRSLSDGMWAGNLPAYPSLAYMRWDGANGRSGKLAIGTGQMYSGSSVGVDQPVEAWWQFPAGKTAMTVGKFWVPFAAQEWQYETKPGVMLNWSNGPHTLAVSSNYNLRLHTMNSYMRFGRTFGEDAGVGLSLGYGKGLSFDTDHDRAWGLDATFAAGGFRFFGEYMGALQSSGNGFGFLYGKAVFEKMGLWKPFVGFYMWNDKSGAFGRFRSSVYGMAYQVTPSLALESAISPTSDRQVSWLQLHFAWER